MTLEALDRTLGRMTQVDISRGASGKYEVFVCPDGSALYLEVAATLGYEKWVANIHQVVLTEGGWEFKLQAHALMESLEAAVKQLREDILCLRSELRPQPKTALERLLEEEDS